MCRVVPGQPGWWGVQAELKRVTALGDEAGEFRAVEVPFPAAGSSRKAWAVAVAGRLLGRGGSAVRAFVRQPYFFLDSRLSSH